MQDGRTAAAVAMATRREREYFIVTVMRGSVEVECAGVLVYELSCSGWLWNQLKRGKFSNQY